MNSEMTDVKKEIKKLDTGISDVSVNVIRSTYRQDEVMQAISEDVQKLATARNEGLSGLDKIPQLVIDSSKYADLLSNMAACQKKQNSVIDTNSSSLIELKDQLKSVQATNIANYDSTMGIYNSTQVERKEKITSIQNSQTEIIEMLSTLKITTAKFRSDWKH